LCRAGVGMWQGRPLEELAIHAAIVAARGARGCRAWTELAPEADWAAPQLEMVGFTLADSVRRAKQRTLAQFRACFRNVRLVSGMGGIVDAANGEYICDAIHRHLGRLENPWYGKYGLRFSDSGECQVRCGSGKPLRVSNAISFFGWEIGNYAHWLIEKLGRFYWIDQAAMPDDTVLLVEAGLPASIMESLALFWPAERTLCVQAGRACEVEVLHHFSDVAEIW